MARQITHQPDENGIYRQIVSPVRLREILDEDGDNYNRPEHFGENDEWNVAEETGMANHPNRNYRNRRDTIVTHAWETWTKNGLNLDADMRRETEKTVQDAANNTYVEGISDMAWLAATLARLGHTA